MENQIILMQKGDLHVHLNGLVSTSVIKDLLEREGAVIPENFNIDVDLIRATPAPNLLTYLKPWQVLRLIPNSQNSLSLIIDSAFENLKTNNVTFVELRNSVIYIALLNKITVSQALSWLVSEIQRASEKFNIKAGLILTVSRGDYASDHLRSLLDAYLNLGKPDIIIGLDLAGNEDAALPLDIGVLFSKAKEEYGLNITIHAGETGKIENIIEAIENFGADRIGHGTAAYKSNAVMNLLKERDICVEVCPISNRRTGAIQAQESHPVAEFIKAGVPFVICSDNPAIHCSSITEDYLEFYRETASEISLQNMFSMQKKYSFLKGVK